MRDEDTDAHWWGERGRCRKDAITGGEKARLPQNQEPRGSIPLRGWKPLLVPGSAAIVSQEDPGVLPPIRVVRRARDPPAGLGAHGQARDATLIGQRHGQGGMKAGPGHSTIGTSQQIRELQDPFVAKRSCHPAKMAGEEEDLSREGLLPCRYRECDR